MSRSLLALLFSLALFGCKTSPEPAGDGAMAADAGPPTGASPVEDAFKPDSGIAAKDRQEGVANDRNSGSSAACAADSDCGKGSVCEISGEHAQCAQGCHKDDQCGPGNRCRTVQCIRWPCPGQCEAAGSGVKK